MDRLTRKPEIPGTAASPNFKITFPQGHNQALSEEKSDFEQFAPLCNPMPFGSQPRN